MTTAERDFFSDDDVASPTRTVNDASFGVWQYDADTKTFSWSADVCKLLGYKPTEIPSCYDYFIDNLLHPNDRSKFAFAVSDYLARKQSIDIHIRLCSKNKQYSWFELSAKSWQNKNPQKLIGTLTPANNFSKEKTSTTENELLINEAGKLAKVGGWELDINTLRLTWSKEVYEIYELPIYARPEVRNAISYFEPKHRNLLFQALNNSIQSCDPCDIELILRTANHTKKWVHLKGIPVINSKGQCTLVRGIIQDIDRVKSKENALQASLDMLSEQNKRLQNFAYIVSHNLRSHTGNLQVMVDMYQQAQPAATDDKEIFDNIQAISKNLNATIESLNEIVLIQSKVNQNWKEMSLETVFARTISVLKSNITASKAHVKADFSEAPFINSVPAYMESIFLNMISNAIKYASPNRTPEIHCRSYRQGQYIYLTFKDNGSGIDLNKHGNKLFGMYKTFHRNADAKGLGLFMTRNQIEAMGGKIDVESQVNKGTTFTIRLKY